ncbi:RNase H-like domain found in reverse transcriptase [Popillia japonica]|uniref:RNA-directed DNA polymerase n=1 Tax=Popillia japonica TaxID=7064 RepID=A0AAW1HFG3_POPJA
MLLEQESRDKTAFVTPDGHYQFTRLPFGIANGPAVFQRMINRVLGSLRFTVVMAFMYDLLIPNASNEEELQNLEEVQDFPEPQSIHQVRQFFGLTSYFRRFIRDHGLTAKPLTNLGRRKNGIWTWGQKAQEAFDTLKRKLCENPVLMLYSQYAHIKVHIGACKNELAGAMLQSDQSGQWHPVIYVSRQTTKEEARYHSTELALR